MGRIIHGKRTKGSTAKLTNNCCIFGIMGGTAPLTGVPLAHRAYLEKRASRKALCITDCAKGHKYLKDHGILGCNPQAGGVGNMWRNRHYSHRSGPTPEGDGSAHGSRGIMSELLGIQEPTYTYPKFPKGNISVRPGWYLTALTEIGTDTTNPSYDSNSKDIYEKFGEITITTDLPNKVPEELLHLQNKCPDSLNQRVEQYFFLGVGIEIVYPDSIADGVSGIIQPVISLIYDKTINKWSWELRNVMVIDSNEANVMIYRGQLKSSDTTLPVIHFPIDENKPHKLTTTIKRTFDTDSSGKRTNLTWQMNYKYDNEHIIEGPLINSSFFVGLLKNSSITNTSNHVVQKIINYGKDNISIDIASDNSLIGATLEIYQDLPIGCSGLGTKTDQCKTCAGVVGTTSWERVNTAMLVDWTNTNFDIKDQSGNSLNHTIDAASTFPPIGKAEFIKHRKQVNFYPNKYSSSNQMGGCYPDTLTTKNISVRPGLFQTAGCVNNNSNFKNFKTISLNTLFPFALPTELIKKQIDSNCKTDMVVNQYFYLSCDITVTASSGNTTISNLPTINGVFKPVIYLDYKESHGGFVWVFEHTLVLTTKNGPLLTYKGQWDKNQPFIQSVDDVGSVITKINRNPSGNYVNWSMTHQFSDIATPIPSITFSPTTIPFLLKEDEFANKSNPDWGKFVDVSEFTIDIKDGGFLGANNEIYQPILPCCEGSTLPECGSDDNCTGCMISNIPEAHVNASLLITWENLGFSILDTSEKEIDCKPIPKSYTPPIGKVEIKTSIYDTGYGIIFYPDRFDLQNTS